MEIILFFKSVKFTHISASSCLVLVCYQNTNTALSIHSILAPHNGNHPKPHPLISKALSNLTPVSTNNLHDPPRREATKGSRRQRSRWSFGSRHQASPRTASSVRQEFAIQYWIYPCRASEKWFVIFTLLCFGGPKRSLNPRIDGGRDRPYETILPLSQDLDLVINSMIGRDDGMILNI